MNNEELQQIQLQLDTLHKTLNTINLATIEQELATLQMQLNTLTNNHTNRFRANPNDCYFSIEPGGAIAQYNENDDEFDNFNYNIYNYFETKEQAQKYLNKLNTYTKLKQLAERLNNNTKINWIDRLQLKYFIYYDRQTNKLDTDYTLTTRFLGDIYCLSKNFIQIAIQEIGEYNLKELFIDE